MPLPGGKGPGQRHRHDRSDSPQRSYTSTSSSSSSSSLPAPPEGQGTMGPRADAEGGPPASDRPSTATPSRCRGSPTQQRRRGSSGGDDGSQQQQRPSPINRRQREGLVESPDKHFAYMRLSGAGPSSRTAAATAAACNMNNYVYPDYVAGDRTRTPSPVRSGRKDAAAHRATSSTAGGGGSSTATLSPIRGRTAEEAMRPFTSQSPLARGWSHWRSPSKTERRSRKRTSPLSSSSSAPASATATKGVAASAVVTVDPVAFSMEAYRELHQRQFSTTSEELAFLRRDFVSSRKTLAVLHDETVRLRGELQDRVEEIASLEEKLEWYRRQLDRRRSAAPAQEGVPYERVVHVGRRGSQGAATWEEREGEVEEAEANSPCAAAGDDGAGAERPPGPVSGRQQGTSAIALFAAAGAASARHRRNASRVSAAAGGGADNEINTVALIEELRRNLAKRDTAMDQCRMEVAAAQHARDALDRECRQAKQDAAQARQEQQQTLAALNGKIAAVGELEEAVKALRTSLAEKEEALEALRKKQDMAELLGAYPSAKSVDAGLTQHEYLFDQVKTYRERWQAAEDRVDELSRQLLSLSSHDAARHAPHGAIEAAKPSETEVWRVEAEVRDQLETIRRLQRKMEREQEAAAFREEQTRQQRQADLRQHALEVSALREQLQMARDQLLNEAKDRESLTRQLRQAAHTDTMADTLQSQNSALKQRLAEMTAESAQVHGKVKELEVAVQREMGERARLGRENESLHAQYRELERQAHVLQGTVEDLRTRLGAAEAKAFSLEQVLVLGTDGGGCDSICKSDRDKGSAAHNAFAYLSTPTHGDAAAMASEQKGYAALMNLNVNLQEKLNRMEKEICQLSARKHEHEALDGSDENSQVGDVGRQRAHLTLEVAEVREELRRTRNAQHALLAKWKRLQHEHKQVLADNVLLANGAELLHKELQDARLVAKQAMSTTRRRQRSRKPCTHLPDAPGSSSSRLHRRLHDARQFAGEDERKDESGIADGQEACTSLQLLRENTSYAEQLAAALTAARRQVSILARAIASLPATPLKTCTPHADAKSSPNEDGGGGVASPAKAPAAQKQLFHTLGMSGRDSDGGMHRCVEEEDVAVTITKESTASLPSQAQARAALKPRAELAAEATRVDKDVAALRRELQFTRAERDHWRSLVDRYTVVCTSTIDL